MPNFFTNLDPATIKIAERYAIKLASGQIEEASFADEAMALEVGNQLAGIGHRTIAYSGGSGWIVRRWDILFVKAEGVKYVEWT